jgi:hypothetical protein
MHNSICGLESCLNKGNNKITELRTILQRESQNCVVLETVMLLACYSQAARSQNV